MRRAHLPEVGAVTRRLRIQERGPVQHGPQAGEGRGRQGRPLGRSFDRLHHCADGPVFERVVRSGIGMECLDPVENTLGRYRKTAGHHLAKKVIRRVAAKYRAAVRCIRPQPGPGVQHVTLFDQAQYDCCRPGLVCLQPLPHGYIGQPPFIVPGALLPQAIANLVDQQTGVSG